MKPVGSIKIRLLAMILFVTCVGNSITIIDVKKKTLLLLSLSIVFPSLLCLFIIPIYYLDMVTSVPSLNCRLI